VIAKSRDAERDADSIPRLFRYFGREETAHGNSTFGTLLSLQLRLIGYFLEWRKYLSQLDTMYLQGTLGRPF